MQTETYTKENGKTVKLTAMESSLMITVACTKETGLTTNNTAKEWRAGTST